MDISHKEQGVLIQDMPEKFTQPDNLVEPNIDIVTKKKKKTGFYSLIHTQIGSMRSMLELSQSGSGFRRMATLKINSMKLQMNKHMSNLNNSSLELVEEDNILERAKEITEKREQEKTGKTTLFQGKLQTGSLTDQFTGADGSNYVSYFLINDEENMKGWGVTPDSIPQHIGSFKGMPFVITAKRFFEKSPYGEMTDHPSTDHFGSLGIRIGGYGPNTRPKEFNDLMQQAKFQEEFRVGNIEEVFKKSNGDWHALIKLKPEFANHQMPSLVSPALFQINPAEPVNAIKTWLGMHLAGLDEQPAYGNNAVYKGSCFGTGEECMRKLSASMNDTFKPCFKSKLANINLKLAKIRIDMIQREAAQMSSDHSNIQKQNLLCSNGGYGPSSCDNTNITHEI